MNAPIGLICLVVAIVLFGIGAASPYFYGPDRPSRFGFMSAGLMFYALKDLFG